MNERLKFQSVANDSKVQITFDKQIVDSCRLIGYDSSVMANEDFEDDTKDAGEIPSRLFTRSFLMRNSKAKALSQYFTLDTRRCQERKAYF